MKIDGASVWAVSLLGAWACGPKVDVDAGGGDSSGDESSSATMTSASSVGTATTVGTTTGMTTATSVTTSATTGPDPTTATATVTSATTATSGDPTGGGLPNGSMCSEDFECASSMCYIAGILGGICGECKTDADCPSGGCTHSNPLAQPPSGSFCNDGSYGADCMSDAVCQEPYQCVPVLDVPGVISVSTCSECADDFDCDQGMLCEPDIAIATLAGVWRCVPSGSLANGQSCDFEGSGDAACQSGICAVADLMGLLQVGVCSACEIDDDCPMGQICFPPQVDLDTSTLVPGSCMEL